MPVPAVMPTKAQVSIKPKATRAELIEAMVLLRVEEIREQNKAKSKRREALEPVIKAALIKLALQRKDKASVYRQPSCETTHQYVGGKSKWIKRKSLHGDADIQISVPLSEIPDDLKAKLVEFDLLEYDGSTVDEIRKDIRAKLVKKESNTDRVQALITTPESRAALTAALNALNEVPAAIAA